jgi:hypothetical protein
VRRANAALTRFAPLPQTQSGWRFCSTQPQAPLPRDKLLEEVVELRVTKSVQDTLRTEFSSLRTDVAALNAKIESSSTALNAKIESSNTALNAKIESSNTALNAKIESSGNTLAKNFRQTMKDREVRIPWIRAVTLFNERS